LFTAAELEVGGDEQTVAQFGIDGTLGYPAAVIPSWRAVYDLADLDRSVGTLPTGNSGNPASAHWGDQAGAFAAGGHHPLTMGPDMTGDPHAAPTLVLRGGKRPTPAR